MRRNIAPWNLPSCPATGPFRPERRRSRGYGKGARATSFFARLEGACSLPLQEKSAAPIRHLATIPPFSPAWNFRLHENSRFAILLKVMENMKNVIDCANGTRIRAAGLAVLPRVSLPAAEDDMPARVAFAPDGLRLAADGEDLLSGVWRKGREAARSDNKICKGEKR